MGKATLFFVASVFLGAAFLMYGQQRTVVEIDRQQGRYQADLLARKAAEAGMTLAMSQARRDFDTWRASYTDVALEDASFDVHVSGTPAGPLVFSATGSFGEAEHQAVAVMARLAPAPAALVVDADTVEAHFMGNNFRISGMDTRPGSGDAQRRESNGAADFVNAVWTRHPLAFTAFRGAASGDRADNLRGKADSDDVALGSDRAMGFFPIDLDRLAGEADTRVDHHRAGGVFSNDTFGAPGDPRIVVIEGSAVFNGTSKGYGLLIVNGDLTLQDDFEWEGIVVARGDGEEMYVDLGDNASIYGALVVRHAYEGNDDGGSPEDPPEDPPDDEPDCDCPEPPSGPPAGTERSKNGKKVTICHVPPGNPDNAHTISISVNAFQTHVTHHDDYDGACLPPCSCSTSDAALGAPGSPFSMPIAAIAAEPLPMRGMPTGGTAYPAGMIAVRPPARLLLGLVGMVRGLGCMPEVGATFSQDGLSVTATSTKDLSNVVLNFSDGGQQKFDGLSGYSGTFVGTGGNMGKAIVGAWIKSGCNSSGDGPGYGEYVANPGSPGDVEEGEEEASTSGGILYFSMRDRAVIQYSAEAIGKLAARLPVVKEPSWLVTFDQVGQTGGHDTMQ